MSLHASDLMSPGPLISVTPSTTIGELERILVEKEISGVPVLNEKGNLVGVVSQSDIVRFLYKELDPGLNFYSYLDKPHVIREMPTDRQLRSRKVWEIMHTRLYTVSPGNSIQTVAQILRKHHIHRVLVMDGSQLAGIITTFDLLRVLEDPEMVREFWGVPARS